MIPTHTINLITITRDFSIPANLYLSALCHRGCFFGFISCRDLQIFSGSLFLGYSGLYH
jgi:hypothetical protein